MLGELVGRGWAQELGAGESGHPGFGSQSLGTPRGGQEGGGLPFALALHSGGVGAVRGANLVQEF